MILLHFLFLGIQTHLPLQSNRKTLQLFHWVCGSSASYSDNEVGDKEQRALHSCTQSSCLLMGPDRPTENTCLVTGFLIQPLLIPQPPWFLSTEPSQRCQSSGNKTMVFIA